MKLCEACLEQMNSNPSLLNFVTRVWIYVHQKLNKELPTTKNLSYIEEQIYNYSKERAKEYNKEYYPFEEEDRTEELFQQVEQVLPTGKYIINYVTFTDTYLYHYITSHNTTNILKAVTTHNTKDLLFLYPVENLRRNWGRMVQDDLLLVDQTPNERPTQMEKFKQKYKKFL